MLVNVFFYTHYMVGSNSGLDLPRIQQDIDSYKESWSKKLTSFSACNIDHLQAHVPVRSCKLRVWGEKSCERYFAASHPNLNLWFFFYNCWTCTLHSSQWLTKPENSVIGWNETITVSQSICKQFVRNLFWYVQNAMQLFFTYSKGQK